jgi:putative ABC transport system ATP-binding protein
MQPSATTTALELTGVTKRFAQPGQTEVLALDDVTLRVQKGEFVMVVGHNGSGKSTLLNVVSGDLSPDAGSLRWSTTGGRPRVARVRQAPGDGTFPDLSVLENFQIFNLRGVPSVLRTQPRAAVRSDATVCAQRHALAGRLDQRVSELSGGQRQLLALDLAMARAPDVLLLDEHTASLDRQNADRCMSATARLAEDTRTTVIMVTHNLSYALRYGDVLVVLRDGRLIQRLSGREKDRLSLPDLMRLCGFVAS